METGNQVATTAGQLPEPKVHSDQLPSGPTTDRSSPITLVPCGAKTGFSLLASCLTLVAPSGMTAEERKQWLAVARDRLKGIPEDLLARGCYEAQGAADHPAKVVPAILKAIGKQWEARQRIAREDGGNVPALPAPEPEAVPHDITQAILREVGLKLQTDEAKGAN